MIAKQVSQYDIWCCLAEDCPQIEDESYSAIAPMRALP
jgi:hypothetical protein